MFFQSRITSEEGLPLLQETAEYGAVRNKSSNPIKYPLAVCFILLTKFFEAFAANGIRTILVLYLRDDIQFNENLSTIMLHVFNFFGQLCPILGAIIADCYLGNVRSILYFSYVYATGWLLLIITSLPIVAASLSLILCALLLTAIGNGSIRACIASLGALQFKLPEQTRQLSNYFSLYYLVYYSAILLSKVLPPMIRVKTKCFNKDNCYTAVFGALGGSFFISWMVFAAGKCYYSKEKIKENVLLKLCRCIRHAIIEKWNNKRHNYWLHNAIGKYSYEFVCDVSKVLKIWKIILPLPIYFALLAQQDSSWTFQAAMMNTTVMGVTLEADQAKAIGPIILVVLIPIWQHFFTPMLKRLFGYEMKPLISVAIGGLCAIASFICAGILQEFILNASYGSISVVWQIPQFFLMMLGELFLAIPGLEFAFTEAPKSMKSVVIAAWFLNNAVGNLLVILITNFNMFTSNSMEFFFYAALMIMSTTIYSLLAYNYFLETHSNTMESSNQLLKNRNDTKAIIPNHSQNCTNS